MPLRVLTIDDNEDDLLFTRIALTRCGVEYTIDAYLKAQEALDHLRDTPSHGVDLILLDINMPVMNGFDFLEAFEALTPAQRGSAVVVLLTSSSDSSDRESAARFASVRGFLTKPLERSAAAELPALTRGH
jgi:CheY-like chemotaxis protein